MALLVRDEANTISRCIDSAIPLVSSCCVIDTGSRDTTLEMIEAKFVDKPLKVLQTPFTSFANHYSDLYRSASEISDYVLFLDADETSFFGPEVFEQHPPFDVASIEIQYPRHSVRQARLFRTQLDISCEGFLKPRIRLPDNCRTIELQALTIKNHEDGYRALQARQAQFDRLDLLAEIGQSRFDQQIYFELGCLELPNQAAEYFFNKSLQLAEQSAAANEEAMEYRWQANYFLGRLLLHDLNQVERAIAYLNQAYEQAPARAEPLVHLIRALCKHNQLTAANELLEVCRTIEMPQDQRYFERAVYQTGFQ